MACECGAYKTYGTKYGEAGHSHWCPESGYAKPERTPRICDGMTVAGGYCYLGATHWVYFHTNGPKFHYCDSCFNDTVAAAIYGTPIQSSGRL